MGMASLVCASVLATGMGGCSLARLGLLAQPLSSQSCSRCVLVCASCCCFEPPLGVNVFPGRLLAPCCCHPLCLWRCTVQRIPVRRRDFLKNIKKHYAKMLIGLQVCLLKTRLNEHLSSPFHLHRPSMSVSMPTMPVWCVCWQAYALVTTGVRLSVFNQPKSRARTSVLSTQGNATMRLNISNVFGSKFLASVEPVSIDLDVDLEADADAGAGAGAGAGASADAGAGARDDSRTEEEGDSEEGGESKHQMAVGFVSKAGTGIARSNNDKQFLFINGRPVDIPKVRFRCVLRCCM